jgi:hypothetical protein
MNPRSIREAILIDRSASTASIERLGRAIILKLIWNMSL